MLNFAKAPTISETPIKIAVGKIVNGYNNKPIKPVTIFEKIAPPLISPSSANTILVLPKIKLLAITTIKIQIKNFFNNTFFIIFLPIYLYIILTIYFINNT